jgi:outer membrane protein W
MRQTTQRIPTILLAVLLMCAAAGAADEETTGDTKKVLRPWQFRFGAVVTDSNGGGSLGVEPGHVNASLDAGGGGSISLERRISPLIGIEFGITATASNFGLSTGVRGKAIHTSTYMLTMTPVTVGANFHLVDDGPIDVYVGPLLAYARYSELSLRTGTDWWPRWPWWDDDWTTVTLRNEGNSELTWGGRAGLGVFFGKRKKWSGQFTLTYIDATYEFNNGPERESVSLDPLMFGFGFGFRF